MPSTSGSSLEIMMIAMPFARKLAHQAVDLGLGADVDAARRLVHDEDARLGREPFRQADLLLVAAGKLSDDLADAARADLELLDAVARRARSPPCGR